MSTVSLPLPSSQTYSLVPELLGGRGKGKQPGPSLIMRVLSFQDTLRRGLHCGALALVQGFSDMNFQFCCFRNISGQDLTDQCAPAWILLDLKQRNELKLRMRFNLLSRMATGFGSSIQNSFAGESQVKAVFPTQCCIFPTEMKVGGYSSGGRNKSII